MAARLANKAVNCRQAKAGPLAFILGGEERLEAARACTSGDIPNARVGYGELDIDAGENTAKHRCHIGIDVRGDCLHEKLAAVLHGVACIQCQVENGILPSRWRQSAPFRASP